MVEYVARGNDFTEYDNEYRFVREDKNGSRYYIDTKCPRCGGTGRLPEYKRIDNGVCYLCGGSGYHETNIKVYREDYHEKLVAKRLAKIRAGASEYNKEYLRRFGLSENGEAWVVLGNTYEIKDDLKEEGAKFSDGMGWHFDHKPEKYDTLYLEASTVIGIDDDGRDVHFLVYSEMTGRVDMRCGWWLADYVKKAQEEYVESHKVGEYVGAVGERVSIDAIYDGCSSFERKSFSGYGTTTMWVERFVDEHQNLLVWITSSNVMCDKEKGDMVKVTGTVKEHKDYKGKRQTVLARCKVC